MSENKKYIANNRQSLSMVMVLPGGGQHTIEFKPGYGLLNEGHYFTNDPKVQELLEKDKRFNKTYRLEEINNMNFREYNARKELGLLKKEETKTNIIEKEFETVNAAKDFFHDEPYGIGTSKLTTKAQVVAIGKELNFNVTFKSDNN